MTATAISPALPSAGSTKPRVEGTISDDGRVLCTCGKKCGYVEDGLVEFVCQCGNRVTLDSNILFLRNCERAIDGTHKALDTLATIMNLMASKQKSVA